MPVPHPDVNRKHYPAARQRRLEAARLAFSDFPERRYPTEQLVVMRDFLDPSRRHSAPAQNILQERPHVVWTLGPAKRNQEHGIERAATHTGIVYCSS